MKRFEISELMKKHGILTFTNMDELLNAISHELSGLASCKFAMTDSFLMKQYIFSFSANNLVQFVKNNPFYQNHEVQNYIDMSALLDVQEIQYQFKTEKLDKLFKNSEYDFHFYLLDMKNAEPEGVLLMTQ